MKGKLLLLFPMLFTLMMYGQSNLTLGDIYDFDVGDKFRYEKKFNGGWPDYEWVKVLNKSYSFDSSEVTYTNLVTVANHGIPATTDTVVKVYTDLKEPYYHNWPDSAYLATLDSGHIFDTVHTTLLCNDSVIGYNFQDQPFLAHSEKKRYGKGLGLVWDSFSWSSGSWGRKELRFYYKSSKNCGLTSISETSLEDLKVYPNPWNNKSELNIAVRNKLGVLEVFDITGKLMFKTEIDENIAFGNGFLTRGMYLIKVQVEDQLLVKKLIVE